MGLKDSIRPKRMGSSVRPELDPNNWNNCRRRSAYPPNLPILLRSRLRQSGIRPRQAPTSTSRLPAKTPSIPLQILSSSVDSRLSCGVSVCVLSSLLRSVGSGWLEIQPEMVITSALPAKCSVFLHQDIPLLPKYPAYCATRVDYLNDLPSTSRTVRRTKIQYIPRRHFGTKLVVSAAKNDQLRLNDEFPQEPFWLSLIADFIWGVKSLFTFLLEQPSQLKYVEWPTFSNTVRTATLTLVLVALLIVALASVDSALCYILALVLRKAS